MIITATCIGDAAQLNIDNDDHKVCFDAYNDFLREHRDHQGEAGRMADAIATFRTMDLTGPPKT